MMKSSGEVSEFLKTFLFIFWGFFSYYWRYFDTTFRIQSLVYLVANFLASLLVVFAMATISSIHSLRGVVSVGGCEILTFWRSRIPF
jgi:hypothetical protein